MSSTTLPIPGIVYDDEEEETDLGVRVVWYQMRSLAHSDQNQDDQPSTGGISQTVVLNEPTSETGQPTEGCKDEDDQSASKKTKKEEAIEEFIEKVSIAGIQETYRARFAPEKIMWCVSLLLACIGILYTSYGVIVDRTAEMNAYNDMEYVQPQAPFPNVTVCAPGSIVEENFPKVFKITDDIAKYMRRHNISEEDVFSRITIVDLTRQQAGSLTTLHAVISMYESAEISLPLGWIDLVRLLSPSCAMTLSDCSYNGEIFDCCDIVGEWNQIDGTVCFKLNVSTFLNFAPFCHKDFVSDRKTGSLAPKPAQNRPRFQRTRAPEFANFYPRFRP